jgi:hypothetical protein
MKHQHPKELQRKPHELTGQLLPTRAFAPEHQIPTVQADFEDDRPDPAYHFNLANIALTPAPNTMVQCAWPDDGYQFMSKMANVMMDNIPRGIPGSNLLRNKSTRQFMGNQIGKGMNYAQQQVGAGFNYMRDQASEKWDQTKQFTSEFVTVGDEKLNSSKQAMTEYLQQNQWAQKVRQTAQAHPEITERLLEMGQDKLEGWAGRHAINSKLMFYALNGKISNAELVEKFVDLYDD